MSAKAVWDPNKQLALNKSKGINLLRGGWPHKASTINLLECGPD